MEMLRRKELGDLQAKQKDAEKQSQMFLIKQ